MKTHIDNTIEEKIKELLIDTFYCSIFSKEMHDRVLSVLDEGAFDECVEELTDLIQAQSKRYADKRVRAFRQYVNDQKGLLTNANLDLDLENFLNQNTESDVKGEEILLKDLAKGDHPLLKLLNDQLAGESLKGGE